jgi:proline iminopeptidase
MLVEANGVRLWFDVDGAELVPDGREMRARPTVVLVHGGPGGHDHSYFKPDFARLTDVAQVVYLDLRDHGRSARHDPADWNFELCADDVRAFCDVVGITRPIVFGHSMGGMIALLYAARHPGHAGGLILQSTMSRFDLDRLVEGVRKVAGDDVAELARREYSDGSTTDSEWAAVFAAFGPRVPDDAQLARRTRNPELIGYGMNLLCAFDAADAASGIACPTLVCVGRLAPVTPVAAAQETYDALPAELAHLEIVEEAGHFPWLDVPDSYWPIIKAFVVSAKDRNEQSRTPIGSGA